MKYTGLTVQPPGIPGRPPHGGRGLKSDGFTNHKIAVFVAPRTGGVD